MDLERGTDDSHTYTLAFFCFDLIAYSPSNAFKVKKKSLYSATHHFLPSNIMRDLFQSSGIIKSEGFGCVYMLFLDRSYGTFTCARAAYWGGVNGLDHMKIEIRMVKGFLTNGKRMDISPVIRSSSLINLLSPTPLSAGRIKLQGGLYHSW